MKSSHTESLVEKVTPSHISEDDKAVFDIHIVGGSDTIQIELEFEDSIGKDDEEERLMVIDRDKFEEYLSNK